MANALLKEDRVIHMLVFDNLTQYLSIISGVYAPAQPLDKDAFWVHLRNLNFIIDKPWCLIRDFNELECPIEKSWTYGSTITVGLTTLLPELLLSNHFANSGMEFHLEKAYP